MGDQQLGISIPFNGLQLVKIVYVEALLLGLNDEPLNNECYDYRQIGIVVLWEAFKLELWTKKS